MKAISDLQKEKKNFQKFKSLRVPKRDFPLSSKYLNKPYQKFDNKVIIINSGLKFVAHFLCMYS
jgi:hypothetical protein